MYYRALDPYLRERFGTKVYKLALDGGMTCPTRDGTLGTRGCIFCSRAGSGDFAAPASSIDEQIERAKKRVAAKAKNARYIAYFQSFTNTYAPVDYLERLFYPAVEREDVAALSIATRPDCLPEPVLELISRLAKIKPVFVELGLQTIYSATAKYIRRGYDLPVYDGAVAALHAAGAETVTHMIIGLPGETPEMMYETARYIGRSGADGVKLQLLHILSSADLAAEYAAGRFETLSMEEYVRILAGCVRSLSPDIVIHRLTGDGDKRELIAPLWSGNKKAVLNAINRYFKENNVTQGEWFY